MIPGSTAAAQRELFGPAIRFLASVTPPWLSLLKAAPGLALVLSSSQWGLGAPRLPAVAAATAAASAASAPVAAETASAPLLQRRAQSTDIATSERSPALPCSSSQVGREAAATGTLAVSAAATPAANLSPALLACTNPLLSLPPAVIVITIALFVSGYLTLVCLSQKLRRRSSYPPGATDAGALSAAAATAGGATATELIEGRLGWGGTSCQRMQRSRLASLPQRCTKRLPPAPQPPPHMSPPATCSGRSLPPPASHACGCDGS